MAIWSQPVVAFFWRQVIRGARLSRFREARPTITYAEPDGVLRRLRQHDLSSLRCAVHGVPPQVTSSQEGLTIAVCCTALDDLVSNVLGP